jgi:hypothetical protein
MVRAFFPAFIFVETPSDEALDVSCGRCDDAAARACCEHAVAGCLQTFECLVDKFLDGEDDKFTLQTVRRSARGRLPRT